MQGLPASLGWVSLGVWGGERGGGCREGWHKGCRVLERGARQGYGGETAGLRGGTRVVWGLPGRLEGPCRGAGGLQRQW